jgi:hypothetical protein
VLRAVGVASLLVANSALGEDQPEGECLPEDFHVRVSLEPPEAIAKRLAKLMSAGEDPLARSQMLRQLFADAGCPEVREQADRDLPGPNLICAIPGAKPDLVVVGASPEYDGVPGAALLPAFVALLGKAASAHTFQIVALAHEQSGAALGAKRFVEELPSTPAHLFVHLGYVGYGPLRLENGIHEVEACRLRSLADLMGVPLRRPPREPQELWTRCWSRSGLGLGCSILPIEQASDRYAFTARGVRSAGLTAQVRERMSFDPASVYAAYRLLAAYLLTIDQLGVD